MNEEEELLRKARILREGISEEALRLLMDEFEFDSPVFINRDKFGRPLPVTNFELFQFEGIRRDGAHSVIKHIINMRKIKKHHDRHNTTNN